MYVCLYVCLEDHCLWSSGKQIYIPDVHFLFQLFLQTTNKSQTQNVAGRRRGAGSDFTHWTSCPASSRAVACPCTGFASSVCCQCQNTRGVLCNSIVLLPPLPLFLACLVLDQKTWSFVCHPSICWHKFVIIAPK